jgi:hypothetical protein
MIPTRSQAAFLAFFLATIFLAIPVGAQEFRASITGVVTDPSAGVVPGAQVTVTNVATGVSTSTATSATGYYTVLYLVTGEYRISVEAPGFKKLAREGIVLRLGDELKLDLALEVGKAAQSVEVRAAAPLLQTNTASTGQIYDAKLLMDLPLPDGNPLTLERLVAGVTYYGPISLSRPFDNSSASSISSNGGSGPNQYTLNGSPNAVWGGAVAFVPPRDAVSELKIETFPVDAQSGHTANTLVNITTKNGTNKLHGTAYENIKNNNLSANDFFSNMEGAPKPILRYNLWGGTAGGPIIIPKLYNGLSRSFFFFSYENIYDNFPGPGLNTVPTLAERAGDFSALLPYGIQIYDPMTAQMLPDGLIQRSPFPNNIIPPDRISPIAQNYQAFYPTPNAPALPMGFNNYYTPNPGGDHFNSETVRIDHTISAKQNIFFDFSRNFRLQFSGPWAPGVNGVNPSLWGGPNFPILGTFDHTIALSPTTVLDYRFGYSRYQANWSPSSSYDISQLGFSPYTVGLFGGAHYLPNFSIGSYAGLSGAPGDFVTEGIYSANIKLAKAPGGGRHQLKFGYDLQVNREDDLSPGCNEVCVNFDSTYTGGPQNDSPWAPIGQDYAAFLLGIPSPGGGINRNASYADQTVFNALYVNDEWKVTRKLVLDLGLRYEYESPTTERYNRGMRSFDFTAHSPIEAAAQAAYAASPIPQIPPADFHVLGGVTFLDSSHRMWYTSPRDDFQPRIGLAYNVTKDTVLRAAWGLYAQPWLIDGPYQDGFSYTTPIIPSLDGGLTFVANLYNPLPNGVITPPGASLGLSTDIGSGVGVYPLHRTPRKTERWELSFQRQLPGQILLEAAYVGSQSYHLATDLEYDSLPASYLSTTGVRNQPVIDFLSQQVSNPFQGLAPNTGLDGPTSQITQLLIPYPQFYNVSSEADNGTSNYNAAQFRFERRFSKGYELIANYTLSHAMQKQDKLNITDPTFNYRLSNIDHKHEIKAAGIWELPFGNSRKWGRGWKGLTQGVLGGWQAEGTYTIYSGGPVFFGTDYLFNGDRASVALPRGQRTIFHWLNTSGFVTDPNQQLAYEIRTAPLTFPHLRQQALNLGDLSAIKAFALRESVKLEARCEFFNAFNHPEWGGLDTNPVDSNFGMYSYQRNLPRNIMLGLKLIF